MGFPRRAWCRAGFWQSRIFPADRLAVTEFFAKVARGRGKMGCEYRVFDANDNVRWMRTVASLANGTHRATVAGAHRDVTTEQLALDGLADAERRYELVTRLGRVSLWEYRAGAWLQSDDVLAHMFGLDAAASPTAEEWMERIHPDDRSRVLEHSERLLDVTTAEMAEYVAPPRIEFRVRGEAGEWRWLTRAEAVIQGDGREAKLAAVVSDITPEVFERNERRRLEQLYRAVWTSIPGAAVALDAEGRIIEANCAWREARAGGGAHATAVGDSYVDALRCAAERGDDSAAPMLEGVLGVLDGAREASTLEYQSTTPDQAVRWFRMSAFPLRPPARGAIVVHWDITDRKLADMTVQRGRDHLAELQRMATMSELATSIAHELNQPLAAIMAAASTLRRQLRADDRVVVQTTIDDIIESTARAAEVMRRARAMSRRDSGLRETLTMNEIVDAVTRLLASDLVIQQVTLTTALAEGLPSLVGDRIQLQQVLLNLLLNAIDAVADQPRDRRRVHITTSAPGERRIEVAVSDLGRGLAPEIADHVFDPFATTKPEGTGLGLAIVRAIVEAHGGRVTVESATEGGAAFRVNLPC